MTYRRACWCFALIASLLAFVRYVWQLSVPIPFDDPEMLEEWLGCKPVEGQVARVALRQLIEIPAGGIRSSHINHLRRDKRYYRELARVQILNGSLYVTCPFRNEAPNSACFNSDTLALLLSLTRMPDVDFLYDGGENVCHGTLRRSKPVAIFTTETADGCDNVLTPPRAFVGVLPDNARWAARAAQGVWAWHQRINNVLFRGTTTGGRPFNKSGHLQSLRAKAVAFSLQHPELLDARFATRSGTFGEQDEQELLRRGMTAERGSFLTWYDALKYRAALVLDGNTVADRLAFIMASTTAVIKVDSPRREAYYSLMQPYVHYVPVHADLSNLEAQLRWALANETRLHTIARNGAKFALAHLSRRATLCHWTTLLIRYATYMAGPVELDAHAVRVPLSTPSALPTIIEPIVRSNALRPQLSHSPLQLSDLPNLLKLHMTPCVGLSWRHVCVDVSRR